MGTCITSQTSRLTRTPAAAAVRAAAATPVALLTRLPPASTRTTCPAAAAAPPAEATSASSTPVDDSDHSYRPPPADRQPPIGEHPQQDRDADQPHRPARQNRHRHPAEGQCPVMHPVVHDHVIADRGDPLKEDRQQQPADRVTWPASRQQGPDRHTRRQGPRRQPRVAARRTAPRPPADGSGYPAAR